MPACRGLLGWPLTCYLEEGALCPAPSSGGFRAVGLGASLVLLCSICVCVCVRGRKADHSTKPLHVIGGKPPHSVFLSLSLCCGV